MKSVTRVPTCRVAATVLAVLVRGLCAETVPDVPVDPPSRSELGYAVGVIFGSGMRAEGLDVDCDRVAAAMRDSFRGTNACLGVAEARVVLERHRAALAWRARVERQQLCAANRARGQHYLGEVRQRPGVCALESGLLYEVLQAAEGEPPTTNDVVQLDFHGFSVEGVEFDNNTRRARPDGRYAMKLFRRGLQEALCRMATGARWRVHLPAELAYGDDGRRGVPGSPDVEPGATLVYELTLLGIERAQPVAQPGCLANEATRGSAGAEPDSPELPIIHTEAHP